MACSYILIRLVYGIIPSSGRKPLLLSYLALHPFTSSILEYPPAELTWGVNVSVRLHLVFYVVDALPQFFCLENHFSHINLTLFSVFKVIKEVFSSLFVVVEEDLPLESRWHLRSGLWSQSHCCSCCWGGWCWPGALGADTLIPLGAAVTTGWFVLVIDAFAFTHLRDVVVVLTAQQDTGLAHLKVICAP